MTPPQNPEALAKLAKLRTLHVFAELVAVHGPGYSEALNGKPVTLHGGNSRMCWVWFPGGVNINFAVDVGGHASGWSWRVMASGPAGHVEALTYTAEQPPAEAMLRAAAAAAGLLPELDGMFGLTPAQVRSVVLSAGFFWDQYGDPHRTFSDDETEALELAEAAWYLELAKNDPDAEEPGRA